MFSKLKALVGLGKFWVIVFSIVQKMITQNFHFQAWFQYAKVKVQVIVFGYWTKIDIGELGIVTSKQFHVSWKNSDLSLLPCT